MKIKSVTIKVVLLAIMSAVSLSVNAATISFTDTVALQNTNWADTLTVDKFDGTLGTLTSIQFTLEATVEGNASFENLDSASATISMDLSSQISLNRPSGGNLIVDITPVANQTETVSAYDGTIDFAGTSGNAFLGLSETATDMASSSSVTDLALFTAAFMGETISLDVSALGMSTGSGAGNLVTQFATQAGAALEITYTFDANTNPVPEPTTYALFALGLGALGIHRRRKMRKAAK